MSDLSDQMLLKARESYHGAVSEHANGRHNNAANRAYHACFQAAVAALDLAGFRPRGARDEWPHDWVQAQFSGILINRRKRYPSELRDVLGHLFVLREQADYRPADVSRTQARRMLNRAHLFVQTIVDREGGPTL